MSSCRIRPIAASVYALIVVLASPVTAQTYEGYSDALTTGGAGGSVVTVTNLNDSGAGSLRAAIAALTGSPTEIRFSVGGKICVSSEITIVKPFVTIAGETAPSPGITLECAYSADRGLGINTTDVIVRHLRIRNSPLEGIQIWGDARIIIDHCSVTWSGDGAIDWNMGKVTISRTLIAGNIEGCKTHGDRVSVHHNLFTDNNRRQPRVFDPAGPAFDIRNNFIRKWVILGTQVVGAGASCNIINNFYGPPAPGETYPAGLVNQSAGPFYTAGNATPAGSGWDPNSVGTTGTPFEQPSVTTIAATSVPSNILADVGAQPNDSIDLGWINAADSVYNSRPTGWIPPSGLCDGGGGGGGDATFLSPDTKDGWVLESTETSGVGGSTKSTVTRIGDDASRKQYVSILHFDTSSIPDGATVTKAMLSVRRLGTGGTPTSLGSITVDIKTGFYGTSDGLAAHDFEAASTATAVATLPFPGSNGAWVSSDLNSSGRGAVNKTGITQIKIRFATDDDNDSTTDYLDLYDNNDPPKLYVEWTN